MTTTLALKGDQTARELVLFVSLLPRHFKKICLF